MSLRVLSLGAGVQSSTGDFGCTEFEAREEGR